MSVDEVKRLSNDAKSDTALAEQIKGFGSDIDGLVGFANSKGYKFSRADLDAQVTESKGQLSDEELDRAAGGEKHEGPHSAIVIYLTVT